MTSVRAVRGRLEGFRLVELLQVMGLSANTGALHLHAEDGRGGLVYFDGGAIVNCGELDTDALTLGNVLQQLRMVSADQVDHAFHLQTLDPLGKRIGERLVDLGQLTREQLAHALKTQALWTLRELALWSEGTYEFHSGERLPPEQSEADAGRIDPTEAVMEVLRYEHEWESLRGHLPDGMRTRVAMASAPPIGHTLSFPPGVWRVIARVNTCRTVRRIATRLAQPELEIARMVAPLVRDHVLVTTVTGGHPGLPHEAERMSLAHFDLFSLLISMEQEWIKHKQRQDKLIALASFINQTMQALEEACAQNALHLAPDTLGSLVRRARLERVAGYRFSIADNCIDLHDFAVRCRDAFAGSGHLTVSNSRQFDDEMFEALVGILTAAFEAINTRISSPVERAQNQEAWEALFGTFRSPAAVSG